MKVIDTVVDMEAARERVTGTIGLVPTMGYLHEGHLSLVRRAYADNDNVVVSVFVNPTQFGPGEDFERYPRDEKRDLALLEREGVDTVFIPTAEEIYPPGFNEWVEVHGPLTERLEGAPRPGHFRGVTTVVARLFRIIRPRRAYFGQKDAQQLRVIRRMVAEQKMDVEIVTMPTVREPDGLALSSRNVYLTAEQRPLALRLSQALQMATGVVSQGITDANEIRGEVSRCLTDARIEIDYISIADEQTMEELESIDRPALMLVAARIGATRLIDNTIVVPKGMPVPADLRSLMEE
jgi:pantoate--beta-alanine ligase